MTGFFYFLPSSGVWCYQCQARRSYHYISYRCFKKSSDVIVNNLMVVHLNIQMTWTSFLNKIPHKMQELENLCSSISVKKLNLYLKTFSE